MRWRQRVAWEGGLTIALRVMDEKRLCRRDVGLVLDAAGIPAVDKKDKMPFHFCRYLVSSRGVPPRTKRAL